MIQPTNPNQYSPEQAAAASQEIRAALQEANLPAEKLVEIGEWAQRVINNPQEFPAFRTWLKEQGLPDSEIPKKPDYQELMTMVVIGHLAKDMENGAAEPGEMPEAPQADAGPVNPEQLQSIAAQGRNGDTMLAHINPQEAAVLKQMGGTGTINPATGLPEYGFFSDLWRGIKNVVKKAAPYVLPIVAIAFPALIPAVGTALGASAALAPVVGAAAIAGGVTALSGGSLKEVLSSAALTGLGAYLTPIVGKYVGSAVGITSPSLQSAIGSATLAGGFTALRGGTVSQVLHAAASGAAANYLGQIASNAINGGLITNTKITQQPFDDAVFAAADAEQLAKQGLGKQAIEQVLRSTGLSGQVATQAASLAASGKDATAIAVAISNSAGGTKNLYTNKQTGVQNSVLGGGNVKALETLQGVEDAYLVANDAAQLRAQNLNEAAIKQNLIAAGVDPKVANFAAYNAVIGTNVDAITSGINQNYKGVNVFTDAINTGTTTRELGGDTVDTSTKTTQTQTGGTQTTDTQTQTGGTQTGAATTTTTTSNIPAGVNADTYADYEFAAADAAQLKAQGLSTSAIQQNLTAAGVDPNIARQMAYYASIGISADNIARSTAGIYGNKDVFVSTGTTTGGASGPVDPYEVDGAQGSRDQDTALIGTGGSTTTEQDPYEVDGAQGSRDEDTALVGTDTRDPYEIDGEQGSRTEDTALVGTDTTTTDQDPYEVDGLQGSRDEDTALVGTETDPYGVDNADGSRTEDTALVGTDTTTTTNTDTGIDTGVITGGTVITDAGTKDTTPPKKDMGTFTPAAPDPSWSIPLQYPGINPGLVGAAIRPAYQTTSPVQAQYYWGRQPYFAYADDLNNYNQVSMPVQPWGLQQGYFEQPLAMPTPYGENMFVQPQPFAYAAAPQPMAAALAPVAPAGALGSIQGIAPTYTLPAAPNYVYNVAPTADQYSVASASPV